MVLPELEIILNRSIKNIRYLESEFHYPLSGKWSENDINNFLIHGKAWVLSFEEEDYCFTPKSDQLSNENWKFDLEINRSIKCEENLLEFPNLNILEGIVGKKVTKINLWQRFIKERFRKITLNGISFIEFYLDNRTTFGISRMNGAIGHLTFYPEGYLNNSIGFFHQKSIAETIQVSGNLMQFEITKTISNSNQHLSIVSGFFA